MESKTKTTNKNRVLLTDPKKRVSVAKKIKGIWKNRKPDPIKELQRMRED